MKTPFSLFVFIVFSVITVSVRAQDEDAAPVESNTEATIDDESPVPPEAANPVDDTANTVTDTAPLDITSVPPSSNVDEETQSTPGAAGSDAAAAEATGAEADQTATGDAGSPSSAANLDGSSSSNTAENVQEPAATGAGLPGQAVQSSATTASGTGAKPSHPDSDPNVNFFNQREMKRIALAVATTLAPVTEEVIAAKLPPAASTTEESFLYRYGFLIFGILLTAFTLLICLWICCTKEKKKTDTMLEPIPLESIGVQETKVKITEGLNARTEYRETRTVVTSVGEATNGATALENQNYKLVQTDATTPSRPLSTGSEVRYTPPRNTPLTGPPAWERRLDLAPERDRVSSRDVIAASRVASAVTTVAAAAGTNPVTPTRVRTYGSQETLERDTPESSRGGSLNRPTSPTYRTQLFIIPAANQDPENPNGDRTSGALAYSEYVGMIRTGPSDFSQFDPSSSHVSSNRESHL